MLLSLCLANLLTAANPASAQSPVQALEPVALVSGARLLRVLPPSGSPGRAPAVTATFGSRFPGNFQPGGSSYGASGGLEAEFPVNAYGTSLTVGGVFFDAYDVYQEDGVWKQDRVRSAPLTVGVLQRVGRIGWTDALGERGVVVEPQLGAGLNTTTGVTTFAGPTREPQPYANGKIVSGETIGAAPYVSAGLRVRTGPSLAFGVEARRYRVLEEGDAVHGGTYLSLSVTATPKLTGRLRKR